jgi:hypothetical protein
LIHIIGVEHNKTQWEYENGSNTKHVFSFANSVRQHIKKLNVAVIAEELSEDVLKEQSVENSTAQKLAQEFNIKHVFCDATRKERKDLGVPCYDEISLNLFSKPYLEIANNSPEEKRIIEEYRKYFPKIERYWLTKIKDLRKYNILFICGKSHVPSFKNLLEEHDFAVSILLV